MKYLVADFSGTKGNIHSRFYFDGKRVHAAKGSCRGFVEDLITTGVYPPGAIAKAAGKERLFPKDGKFFMESLRFLCSSYCGVRLYNADSLDTLTPLKE